MPVSPASVSFTAPAGRVVIVRSCVCSFTGTLQTAVVAAALTPEGGGTPVEFFRGTIQPSSSVQLPYFVMDPGSTLVLALTVAPASGTVRAAGFGSVLSGPPV